MITSTKAIFLILIALLLASCNNTEKIQKIFEPQDSSSLTPSSAAVSGDIIDKSASMPQFATYINDFNSIQTTDGISIVRIKAIVSDLKLEYFKGLNVLQIVYSNPETRLNQANGMYYTGHAQITLWIYNESDGYIRYLLLHELKHHYCWQFDKSYSHDGCFLDTPIDKEYGFIK